MIVIEGLPPKNMQDIDSALQEMRMLVEKYTGASVKTEILHTQKRQIELSSMALE